MTLRMALATIRLAVSPILIGCTPGFLFRAIRRQARKGAIVEGSTKTVQRRLAMDTRELQRSKEADLKDVHNLLQESASSPEGPAALVVCRATDLIIAPSIESNNTG